MSLQAVLKEIKSLQPFANENTDIGPAETMVGRRGRKNQAIERLKFLRRDYANQLLKSAVFILVAGAQREEFQKIGTSEKFGLFANDPDTFYKDLADRVHPTLYQGNASPSNLFDVLGRHLEDKMNELEVNEYNQLIFKETYIQSVKNANEFATLLKQAINEQIGSEIVGVQAAASIVDQAIAAEHSGKLAPIIMPTNDEALITALLGDLQRLTSRVYLVIAGKSTKALRSIEGAFLLKEVTEESVQATFDEILKTV